MSKFWGVNRVLAGFMVMLLAVVLYTGGACAAITPPADQGVKEATDAVLSDPNIASTCDNDVVEDQQRANVSYHQRLETALKDSGYDGDSVKESEEISRQVSNLWFCPIKITMMTDLIGMVADIAANWMSVIFIAIAIIITTIVTQLLNAVCQMLMSAIAAALSYICIPNFNLDLKLPQFQLPGFSGACNGTPLMKVTGGPVLPEAPLNFQLGLPRSNYQGRINVFQ